jgi:hypothetical protein
MATDNTFFSILDKQPENNQKVRFWTKYRNNKPHTIPQNSIVGIFLNHKFWSGSDNWVLSEVEFWTPEKL